MKGEGCCGAYGQVLASHALHPFERRRVGRDAGVVLETEGDELLERRVGLPNLGGDLGDLEEIHGVLGVGFEEGVEEGGDGVAADDATGSPDSHAL